MANARAAPSMGAAHAKEAQSGEYTTTTRIENLLPGSRDVSLVRYDLRSIREVLTEEIVVEFRVTSLVSVVV
jgi:hypothetical protein